MKTSSLSLWWLRIATFLLAALAAASAAYWVLKWSAVPPATSRAATLSLSRASQTDPQVVARLLGGGQKAVVALVESAASRFKLIGVVANRAHGGYALISVDGKPARPYQVGAAISDSLVLQSVATRSAALSASADGPVSFTLTLPIPTSATAAPAAPITTAATVTPAATGVALAASAPAPVVEAAAPVTPPPAARPTRSRSRSSSSSD